MITLGSERWTDKSPNITLTFEYEKQRSGSSMQYRAKITVSTVTGGSYFGYPIYLKLSIGGELRETVTLKSASPSRWSDVITHTSAWYTIANKTTGTTPVSFNVYSGSGGDRSGTYSYNMGVDPAASEITAVDGVLGAPLTLTLTRHNASFLDHITYTCGTRSGVVASSSTASSVVWNSDNGNTVALSGQNIKGLTVDVTFTVTSYSDGSVVGTHSKTVKMAIPDTVVPSVALRVEDATGFQSVFGGYVQGFSKLRITVTPTLAYGSPITTYAITADGATYNTTPVTTPAVQGKDTLRITASVVDARTRTGTATPVDITVLEYARPSVSLSAQRCDANGNIDDEGAYMKISLSASISSLNSRNDARYTIAYTDDAGVAKTITGTGVSYTSSPIACDASRTKTVSATVSDMMASTSTSVTVPIAYTLMDYHSSGEGITLGAVATRKGFDCRMQSYFNGNAIKEVGSPTADTDAVNVAYLIANCLSAKADDTYPSCYYRMVDGEREWINPPMIHEVEYRTTERWMGKPVYTKIVVFGELPNDTAKYVNWSPDSGTVAYVINAVAVTSGGSILNVIDSANISNIWIITDGDYSAYTAYVTLKYIKV